MRHQGVRVALDENSDPLLPDRRLGAVDEVQRAALVEQEGRGRIEVLGARVLAAFARVLLAADDPATETSCVARGVPYREDDPAAEAVVGAAPAGALLHETSGLKVRFCEAALVDQRRRQRFPGIDRVADLMRGQRLVREAAAPHVLERRLAVPALRQSAVVEGDGRVECFAQALPPRVFAAGLLGQLHARASGQAAQRLGEVDRVALHHEVEDVAAAAAAEALPRLASGRDGE